MQNYRKRIIFATNIAIKCPNKKKPSRERDLKGI